MASRKATVWQKIVDDFNLHSPRGEPADRSGLASLYLRIKASNRYDFDKAAIAFRKECAKTGGESVTMPEPTMEPEALEITNNVSHIPTEFGEGMEIIFCR